MSNKPELVFRQGKWAIKPLDSRGREYLNYDSRGPDGFSKSTDSTWTMVYRANQKFASLYVVTIHNPGIAEQDGLKDSSSTQRFTGNVLQQAFVTVAIEEDFQFHGGATFRGFVMRILFLNGR